MKSSPSSAKGACLRSRVDRGRASARLAGSPVQVVKDIATLPNYGTATFDIAPTGALIYAPGGDQTEQDSLIFVDRKGKITPSGAADGHYCQLDMARDGRRL